jgi:hypothetical protein
MQLASGAALELSELDDGLPDETTADPRDVSRSLDLRPWSLIVRLRSLDVRRPRAPTSLLGKAMGCLSSHRPAPMRFVDDGVVPIDNGPRGRQPQRLHRRHLARSRAGPLSVARNNSHDAARRVEKRTRRRARRPLSGDGRPVSSANDRAPGAAVQRIETYGARGETPTCPAVMLRAPPWKIFSWKEKHAAGPRAGTSAPFALSRPT